MAHLFIGKMMKNNQSQHLLLITSITIVIMQVLSRIVQTSVRQADMDKDQTDFNIIEIHLINDQTGFNVKDIHLIVIESKMKTTSAPHVV